jgi:hypothetical protein
MKTIRLLALAVILLMGSAAACQTTPKPEGDGKDAEAVDPGIPADFNDYLRKLYPGLDPGGEHNLFALKDPKDKEKRHEYTIAMTQLVLEYMTTLDMGSTIAKVFDQYSRGKEATQVTFKVLHAVVLRYYPASKPNISESEKLLREVTDQAPDYAYPWFLLAQFFEFPRMLQLQNTSPRDVLAALDKALEIKPDFLGAMLLKCQVYMQANPPRVADVKDLITPFLAKLPSRLDDFELLMMLYATSQSEKELEAKVKELIDGGKLSNAQEFRLRRVQVLGQVDLNQLDAAAINLTEMLKLIRQSEQPSEAIWTNRQLADCWGKKAMRVRTLDPELSDPASRKNFDEFTAEAIALYGLCAEIERQHLPLALRGIEARGYVEFLVFCERFERARDWLVKYLAETDLAAPQRTVLDNLRILIDVQLNPTEDGLLDMYESYVASDNMEKLALSLGLAEQNVKLKQEHFKTERALTFFLGQLDNRVRMTVGFAAVLAADTALQIGGDAIQRAGEAIAARFEKETELNSEEQAKLQAALCGALQLGGHRPSQERGIRHAAKLIEESTAEGLRNMMPAILNVWSGASYLKGLKNPVAEPSAMERFRPKEATAWLKKLADAVAKE